MTDITTIQAPAGISGSTMVARAESLIPLLREHARETEGGRRIAPAVHEAFIDAGLYRMSLPREYSEGETTLPEIMRVLETLARGDTSSAWRVWVSLGLPAMSAFIPAEGAAEMFSAADACMCASVAGMGKAVRVEGGYNVSGHWRFVSGIHQATYTGGLSFVFDGEEQRMTPDGQPVVIGAFFPVADCEVADVWDTTGLRGTGSDDIVLDDVFVPDHRIAEVTKPPRAGLSTLHYIDEDNAANVTCASIAIGTAGATFAWFREMAAEPAAL